MISQLSLVLDVTVECFDEQQVEGSKEHTVVGTCAGSFLLECIKVLLFLDGHLVSEVRCASLQEVLVKELLETSCEVVFMVAVGGSGGEGAAGGPVLLLVELLRELVFRVSFSCILCPEGFTDGGSEKSFV